MRVIMVHVVRKVQTENVATKESKVKKVLTGLPVTKVLMDIKVKKVTMGLKDLPA